MDRYAHRLHDWLESSDFGFRVQLAAHVGALTRDSAGRRGSAGDKRSNRRKGFVRWWTQPVDPSRVVLPAPRRGAWRLLLDAGDFGGPIGARLGDEDVTLPGQGAVVLGAP